MCATCLEMWGMNAALALIIGKLYTPVAAIGARWVRWPTSEFEKCEAKGSVKCENWIRLSSSHPHKKEEFRGFVQKLWSAVAINSWKHVEVAAEWSLNVWWLGKWSNLQWSMSFVWGDWYAPAFQSYKVCSVSTECLTICEIACFLGKLGLCSQNGRLKTYSFPVRWQIWHPPLFWTCLFMISSISAISACFIMFPHVSSYFIIFHPFIFMDFPLRSSTNTTCGWSPNLKSFLRSSVWCFSAQLLEDLGDDLLGFSIRFCQTCSPPTSKKFLCSVFSHLGDFWNLCSRSFGLSKLRKTMSTQGDSPNFTTLRYVAIAILTLASMIFGYLQANYQGGLYTFSFFPKNDAQKNETKTLSENKTTLVYGCFQK